MTTKNTHNNGSQVRVGVRVRPMASQEIRLGGNCSLNIESPSIRMGRKRFTYDAVFDSNYDQTELYESVSTPLLSSFIDGYNATIMAYGQTGSGKTFTMGSEAHVEPDASSQAGLIPRFIRDFFLEMQRKKTESDKGVGGSQILLDYSLKASFLEVYGEDVYDLLDATRCSLPLREDSKGGIVVVGLKNRVISNTAEALQVLHEGTMNRTTAATLMNHTSSRSHAVFTIHLSQVTKSHAGDSTDISTTSQFTFVDLAGSERMKKTGAEGERAREGIKINEGLLALGNVINALADDEKIKKERKIYVPYRQSKLTRLLQDALGGNSQTLFLACVSPSDTNASETLSTLNYANRARNIRNVPTKNVDGTSAELKRLKHINRVLQFELVKSRFQIGEVVQGQNDIGRIDESLLSRNDVEAYIQQVYKVAGTIMSDSEILQPPPLLSFDMSTKLHVASESLVVSSKEDAKNCKRSQKFDHSILEDIDPDEEMAILDHLLELQQHDHEYEKWKEKGDLEMKEMDGELEKQEKLLLQLRESLKVYHGLKGKYEHLMEEVQQLENEKLILAKQLDRTRIDPTKGCSAAIKTKLEKVEMNLSRARRETLNHRQKQRYAEDLARKCKVLERKVNELKHAKLSLMKKQKEDASRYKKTVEAKTKELVAHKRRAKTNDQKMSKLEKALGIQKKNLINRTQYCTKLSEKLKKTEKHIVKLLAMRQNDFAEFKVSGMQRSLQRGGGKKSTKSEINRKTLSKEEIKTKKYIIDRMVLDKVKQNRQKKKYEDLVATYSETMRKVVSEVKTLREVRAMSSDDPCELVQKSTLTKELEENIVDLELKLELIDSELQDLSVEMPKNSSSSERNIEDAVEKLMKGMSSFALKSILLETFSKFVETETERQTIVESLGLKDAALLGVESEVDSLTFKLKLLSKDLADRKALEESEDDHFLIIKNLTDKRNKYNDDLLTARSKLEHLNKKVHQLETSHAVLKVELAESKEHLAVAKSSLKNEGGNDQVNETMEKLQHIWKELGADCSLRENTQKRIEFCLEDTCADALNNATAMKCSTEKEIDELSNRLQMMKGALGISTKATNIASSKENLLKILQKFQGELRSLEVPYRFAAARRRKIIEDVKGLSGILGSSSSELHNDLKFLLEGDKNENIATSEEFGTCNTNPDDTALLINALPANCLETEFLTRCESHVADLRVTKSEMLLKSRELQQKIATQIGEMHLNESQSLELVENWVKRNELNYPKWWDSKFAEGIFVDLAQTKFISSSSEDVSKYLELMGDALSRSAESRRSVSETLKSIIEHAQKTLLDIVGREIDASEAYAGFHDALFRMPPLSKDLILSCISELESLIDGIEAMAQTETEALTVVWEALKVSQGDRMNFWGMLEKSGSNFGLGDGNPISANNSLSASSDESWLIDAAKRAANFYRTLEIRLKKLEGINREVERLRSKQDVKSQILSLDSEIRIMNAKLLDLEGLHYSKKRLMMKKQGGKELQKEEIFKNQIRTKFVRSLKQLEKLLGSWENKENSRFDDSLLSDDVLELLKKDPDQIKIWLDKRTKLVHSRDGGKPSVKKQSNEGSGSNLGYMKKHSARHISGLTPPRKRRALSDVKTNVNINADAETAKSPGLRGHNRSNDDDQSRSPKKAKRKHDSIALPFGSILTDSPIHHNDYN